MGRKTTRGRFTKITLSGFLDEGDFDKLREFMMKKANVVAHSDYSEEYGWIVTLEDKDESSRKTTI